jgi:hypothetical protein
MAEAIETVQSIKTASDGTVKLSIEMYNELLEKAATKPPVINRTIVSKTAEMLAQEHRIWGGTLMGLGASFFVVGALRFRAGLSGS